MQNGGNSTSLAHKGHGGALINDCEVLGFWGDWGGAVKYLRFHILKKYSYIAGQQKKKTSSLIKFTAKVSLVAQETMGIHGIYAFSFMLFIQALYYNNPRMRILT